MSTKRGPIVTREIAEKVARVLVKYPAVLGVELFGSVAREGVGNDLDIILLVDEDRMSIFFEKARRGMEMSTIWAYGDNSKNNRRSAAFKALGYGFLSQLTASRLILGFAELDLFLFTLDWKNDLGNLQSALPHEDPLFMKNIALDAIRIA